MSTTPQMWSQEGLNSPFDNMLTTPAGSGRSVVAVWSLCGRGVVGVWSLCGRTVVASSAFRFNY